MRTRLGVISPATSRRGLAVATAVAVGWEGEGSAWAIFVVVVGAFAHATRPRRSAPSTAAWRRAVRIVELLRARRIIDLRALKNRGMAAVQSIRRGPTLLRVH